MKSAALMAQNRGERETLLGTVNEVAKILLVGESEELDFKRLLAGMEMVGRRLDMDRVRIWRHEIHDGKLYYVRRYEWLSDIGGIESNQPVGTKYTYEERGDWLEKFHKGEHVCLNMSDMNLNYDNPGHPYHVKTILMLPLFINRELVGFFSVADCKSERKLSDAQINLCASTGLMFASYFNQVEQLQENLAQDRLLQELNHQLEATLKKALKAGQAKSDFLSIMSHEMRTPLNAIIGMVEIARSTTDPAKKDESLKKIDHASKHLLGIVNNVLEMAKIEAEKVDLIESEFCLREMLRNIESLMDVPMAEKSHQFKVEIDDSLYGTCIGDEQRLRQIILNLLSNAIAYTPDGGEILLKVELVGTAVGEDTFEIKFSVSDNGIGISAKQQKMLFRMFEQADNSSRRKYGGSGLGLAISQRLVRLMGGSDIVIDSDLGQGATFSFALKLVCFPMEWDAACTVAVQEIIADEFAGRRMLLAEDVEINQEIIISLLEGSGFEIDVAPNGLAVLKMLEQKEYDLILMDVRMPEMDGLEATRRIRKLPGAQRFIPIIAMTANVFTDDIMNCLEAGMNDHIGKPIDRFDMLGKIRKSLN